MFWLGWKNCSARLSTEALMNWDTSCLEQTVGQGLNNYGHLHLLRGLDLVEGTLCTHTLVVCLFVCFHTRSPGAGIIGSQTIFKARCLLRVNLFVCFHNCLGLQIIWLRCCHSRTCGLGGSSGTIFCQIQPPTQPSANLHWKSYFPNPTSTKPQPPIFLYSF